MRLRLVTLPLALLLACGIVPDWTSYTPRPVDGPTAAFTPPALPPGTVVTGCLSPLTDPRDGTRLVMQRASNEHGQRIGDYAVEGGRYGLGPRELLRVDCATWRPLGVVPK